MPAQSTTTELPVAVHYTSGGRRALVFKLSTASALERGADIAFLSCYPNEAEEVRIDRASPVAPPAAEGSQPSDPQAKGKGKGGKDRKGKGEGKDRICKGKGKEGKGKGAKKGAG